ncbi:tRNA pseudouridine(55) synthase TruB [Candidatus Peregrinibacteria bacterium CG10_big_fil_rev_8_21_14_0_10_49_24]|nr:MAG: tRNA pseudouridine(55) synthase TruB [Candidatus Peregrinibacteria bacterium CG11_big_fil_rev_8_21_14_0_20_49_14]PIR51092.1 MAG: tRNA pseudouridine(55) synthase TruB [Candidatus Peregrinibacteria bacterium CG10_big_fil_rev_8_21_14_0_10_49_24]PJA67645.1 MAG: tRNA pseudouridine(55) synthase TruB [Candidatus Peregrinibacteria bacterium CG_4_9_14_3_um_filter_49_12]
MRHGFLLIDKPTGFTSHDAVAVVRKTLGEKKVGHLGTLDPAASGLLVLAVGAKALKVVELFSDLHKEYEAGVRFGAVSTTYDAEGTLEEVAITPGWPEPSATDIQNAIRDRFIGKIQQVPPAYSAIKVGGERAYRKMRQGREVNLPARTVEIDYCKISSYEYPALSLHVECGSGTYIRSLAHDLGSVLRCGGYLSSLRRTKVGEWSVMEAVHPEKVAWAHVRPLKDVLTSFDSVEVSPEEALDLSHGRSIKKEVKPDVIAWCEGLPIAILLPLRDGTRQTRARKVL